MTPTPNSRPMRHEEPIEYERQFRPEDHGLSPPLTKAQGTARWREDRALCEKYPNRYVAFLDNWTGDVLDRKVVAVADDPDEFDQLLDTLSADVREQVETWHVPDPNGPIHNPFVTAT